MLCCLGTLVEHSGTQVQCSIPVTARSKLKSMLPTGQPSSFQRSARGAKVAFNADSAGHPLQAIPGSAFPKAVPAQSRCQWSKAVYDFTCGQGLCHKPGAEAGEVQVMCRNQVKVVQEGVLARGRRQPEPWRQPSSSA